MGAREDLHFGEEAGEVFGVAAGAASGLVPLGVGAAEGGAGEKGGDGVGPFGAEGRVGFEHLAGIGPEAVERGLGAGVAFVGAVAEADQPGVGVAAVIGGLGEGFGGDGGEALVGMGVGGAVAARQASSAKAE